MPIKKDRPKATGVAGIRQDGAGRFLVRVDWTDPRTGARKKREGVATTLAAAVELKDSMKGTEREAPPTRKRFGDFATQWLEGRAAQLAPSTRERFVYALAHLSTTFGQWYLDAMTPVDVRVWRDKAVAKHAAPTVNGNLRVLRRMLDDAVEDGVIPTNPARAVKALREGRTGGRRGRALTATELRRFLDAAEALGKAGEIAPDVVRLLAALAWTGMRKGEALALKWSDYVAGELHIERSVWKREEKATKTDDPRRVVVVPPLAAILDVQRQWLVESEHPGRSSDLIFPAKPRSARAGATRRKADEVVWYRGATTLRKPIEQVVEAAEIPKISPHSFRRTFENACRRAGVDSLVRRSLAGWRTETAQSIYASVSEEERKAAGTAVVALVLGRESRDATPDCDTRALNAKRPEESGLQPGVLTG